jgi:hypothetical protein
MVSRRRERNRGAAGPPPKARTPSPGRDAVRHKEQTMTNLKPETLVLHAGQSPDPTRKSVAVPVYQSAG